VQYKNNAAELKLIFRSLCLRRHSKPEKFIPVSRKNLMYLFYLELTIASDLSADDKSLALSLY
ncbi:MAG: hypothetical protein L0H51_07125, partial [Psychrobacter sp.]|nr:hypothetical protein [Psychrobacter sp.]